MKKNPWSEVAMACSGGGGGRGRRWHAWVAVACVGGGGGGESEGQSACDTASSLKCHGSSLMLPPHMLKLLLNYFIIMFMCLEVGEEVHEVHIQKDQEQPPTSTKFATFLYGGAVAAIWFFCC